MGVRGGCAFGVTRRRTRHEFPIRSERKLPVRTKALDERPEAAGSRATQSGANALAVDFFVFCKS